MIKAINTCPVDTVLQMLYCMWARKMIPHQIIEDCELFLSKFLSLVMEGNHAYARVLFINDTAERNEELVDKFLNKEIVQNMDGSHTEYWNCWGDCWWQTQEDNKLFRTGAFRREYGDCGFGPKCPNIQKFEKNP